MVDLIAALDELLGEDWRREGGDMPGSLVLAGRETWRRRITNTAAGGEVIRAMRSLGWSWRQIEAETEIPQATARRWADRPGEQDPDPEVNS